MKHTNIISRSRPSSPKGYRWKRVFFAVVVVLALPKLAMLFSSVNVDSPPVLSPAKIFDTSDPPELGLLQQEMVHEQEKIVVTEETIQDEPNILERIVRVARGDTLMGILLDAGLGRTEAHAAVSALQEVYNPRALRPGHEVVLTFFPAGDDLDEDIFAGLRMQVDVDKNIMVLRDGEKDFLVKEEQLELFVERAAVQSEINSSLYAAAMQAGMPTGVLIQMIRAFSFDVDFQRDIHPGDNFATLFERQVDDQGQAVREGLLLYANLVTNGRSLTIYRYTSQDGETDYFNESGQSIRKSLMLTPIDGARLSSGYGMRRHPIVGYSRMHKGLDFAATTGTPIMAAGDGIVTQSGRNGDYGISVQLRHPNEYGTLYAHMSRLAQGIRVGAHVKQGEVIGYVGSTGMVTGPHLHYEVHLRGEDINPASVNSPPGRTLMGKDLELFKQAKLDLEVRYAALADKILADAADHDGANRFE